MGIKYDKLWELLKQRGMMKKDLYEVAGISHASVAKLAKNENVNTEILEKICIGLQCDIGEIMEISTAEEKQAPRNTVKMKPIVKWAGGKTQLLSELLPRIPNYPGKYIEPFFGGGALFFALCPPNAIIADSNPELINMYQQVANNVDTVIAHLSEYQNTEKFFYDTRELEWEMLPPAQAAARFIYLNKTCFNGLYRVNGQGRFNVPFGDYKNPKICDENGLRQASDILKGATIICGDYATVLQEHAVPGDFVFLDPPYIPVSEYSDFKRYTKEQFYMKDHEKLADVVHELVARGCYVILTNSNHPRVHQLYAPYQIDIIQTKRHISSKGSTRTGEDVIVTAFPKAEKSLSPQVKCYPPTRFMGSKSKLLEDIWRVSSQFEFDTVLDLFSGSGIVSYMYKAQGKTVISNDHMFMATTYAKAMIENSSITLSEKEIEALLEPNEDADGFVAEKFNGLYYSDADNDLIDSIRANIKLLSNEYKRAIAMSALMRACTKKRPRGIFTYVGHRYDDGRKDLQKSLSEQFIDAVNAINNSVFSNGKNNVALNGDALSLKAVVPDLVYMDPPYYSLRSDNEYVRRYHFIEGLARDWQGVDIQEHTLTKKFKSYETPFATKDGAYTAFDKLFEKYQSSILVVSYSSNCLPSKDEMIGLLQKHKTTVTVVPIDYTYSFGNQKDVTSNKNHVQEYLFVAY